MGDTIAFFFLSLSFYLLPPVEETLLLRAHIEDVLYFQAQRLDFGEPRQILNGSRLLPVYGANLDPHRCAALLRVKSLADEAALGREWRFPEAGGSGRGGVRG